jgi:hypothetical protein
MANVLSGVQHTLDECYDRAAHIERLKRSMERWRTQELDRVIPDEYQRYCALITHLESGGAYVVRHFDPYAAVMQEGKPLDGAPELIRDIVEGFSRAAIGAALSCKKYNRKRGDG